jgi:hypothetical protein
MQRRIHSNGDPGPIRGSGPDPSSSVAAAPACKRRRRLSSDSHEHAFRPGINELINAHIQPSTGTVVRLGRLYVPRWNPDASSAPGNCHLYDRRCECPPTCRTPCSATAHRPSPSSARCRAVDRGQQLGTEDLSFLRASRLCTHGTCFIKGAIHDALPQSRACDLGALPDDIGLSCWDCWPVDWDAPWP